jgi:endonuclease/exonuclease/phosphatase family metal-dependent hydrolase
VTDAPGTRPAPGPDQPPVPVRLVTFNTHHGVGDDRRHDLPRLAKVLAAAEADVICLQEVDRHFGDRSEDVDQALLLSRALDMQLAWGRPSTSRARRRRAGSTATRCCPGCRSWSATSTRCPAAGSRAARCARWSSSTAARCG